MALATELAPVWLVEVFPRDPATDPASATLLRAARSAGLGARAARAATVYELPGAGDEGARKLAARLLSDALLEEARVAGPKDPAAAKGAASARAGERVATCVRRPGVMDPVALSTREAARDVGVELAGDVRIGRRVYLEGDVTDDDVARFAVKALGNEVLDRVVAGAQPLPPRAAVTAKAAARREVPLAGLSDDALVALSKSRTLALDADEMRAVRDHYASLGRAPTDLELETIAQTWSEHCKHKTLTGPIDYVERDGQGEKRERIGNLLKETIFAATRELDLERCVSVFEDNAGVVRFDERQGIAVKVETHNHPSAIEPYGGSGTGVGGVIRDVLGTGLGARPIASIDVFCVGDLDLRDEDVPPGAIHPKRLLAGVVAGVRDYGNRMGIPTIAGAIVEEPRFVGNPLVFCGTIGTIPLERVKKRARPEDRIVVVGGRTGRDGIHGATFSSDALTHESETASSGAVQIGNAIEEKKVQDVLLQVRDRGWLTAVTDCGAGGLSSAVGEMAKDSPGADVDLARVPLKYEGLEPWEVWVSEAQERMVLAVAREHVSQVLRAFEAEDVEAVEIGKFTGTGRLVIRRNDAVLGELDLHFLHDGLPRKPRKAAHVVRPSRPRARGRDLSLQDALERVLAHPSVCSKEWIVRQYDHEVQAGSALKNLQGRRADGPGDAVCVCPDPGVPRGVLVGLGIAPRLSDEDPWLMAWAAVDEAIRNVVAAGGDPEQCALLDNFSWGDCRREDRLGAIVRAARACREASLAHRAPFISGKDSLNNEYVLPDGRSISIPGTLLVTCVAIMDDVRRITSIDLKAPGDRLYVVGTTRAELAGSHYDAITGCSGGLAPRPATDAPALYRKLHAAMRSGLVRAAHDLSEGGLAAALAESAFAGEVGADVDLSLLHHGPDLKDDVEALFSETCGRLLVEVEEKNGAAFEAALSGVALGRLGRTIPEQRLRVRGLSGKSVLDVELDRLKRAWRGTLFELYS